MTQHHLHPYPRPLVEYGDLKIWMPCDNYDKYKSIITTYASNVPECKNSYDREVIITAPNLCELILKLGKKLKFCSGGIYFKGDDISKTVHGFINEIVMYNFQHKLELIQAVMNLYIDKSYSSWDTYSKNTEIVEHIFSYDNEEKLWLVLSHFAFTRANEYFDIMFWIIGYSNEDRLLEPLVYFIRKLLDSNLVKNAKQNICKYYTRCLEAAVGSYTHNPRMLNLFLESFHMYYVLQSQVIVYGISREQYDEVDVILKYYPQHEYKCVNDVEECIRDNRSFYGIKFCISYLAEHHIPYLIDLICNDRILLDDVTMSEICYRCFLFDRPDMFNAILHFYPLIADEIGNYKLYKEPQCSYIDLVKRQQRYMMYASEWKISNDELRTELGPDPEKKSRCIVM